MKKVIGGQAVMEGVMMRSPSLMAMAVRRDDAVSYTHLDVYKRQGFLLGFGVCWRR